MPKLLARTLTRPPAEREHDLPAFWDGRPVTWGDWTLEVPTTLRFHLPESHWACPMCGTIDYETLSCRGRAFYVDELGREIAAHLYATRCLHCAHDQVYDLEADELFDLEAADYTADGSYVAGSEQGALW